MNYDPNDPLNHSFDTAENEVEDREI